MVTDSQGNREMTLVDIKVPEDEKVLGAKNIRDFYKKNQEWIKSQMSGTDEEKKIKYLRYILSNSSAQAKEGSLKKEKDDFIAHYDSEYKKGKTKLPGIFSYNVLINPKVEELTNKSKFKDGTNSYIFDKKEIKSDGFKNLVQILKYYISKSNSKDLGRKIGDAISAMVDTLKSSSVSKEEIKEIIFDKFLISKIDKSLNYFSIANWANNLNVFVNDGIIDSDDILKFLESDKVKEIVEKESKSSPVKEAAFKDLIKKMKANSLNEGSVRKYITELLASKYNK